VLQVEVGIDRFVVCTVSLLYFYFLVYTSTIVQ